MYVYKIISSTQTNGWMQHEDDYITAILAKRYSHTRHSPEISASILPT
jgi:hypothetical protein